MLFSRRRFRKGGPWQHQDPRPQGTRLSARLNFRLLELSEAIRLQEATVSRNIVETLSDQSTQSSCSRTRVSRRRRLGHG